MQVGGELRIAAELRVDGLLQVLADVTRDPHDRGEVLRGMWGYLVWVGLLEFKSISRPFRSGDLLRLPAYGFAWLASHKHGKALRVSEGKQRAARRDDITLFLVVSSLSEALKDEVDDLGYTLTRDPSGYLPVVGAPLRLVVVDLSVAGAAERDELMQWFAGVVKSLGLEARRWLHQHTRGKGAMNATPELEGWDDWLSHYIAAMPPEERLAGLAPEERLAGLAPEERLAGLAPEERLAGLAPEEALLALPVEILRTFPDAYLATLSASIQARIRARLGQP